MSINRFFTEKLGAELKNIRWSWGAVDRINHRVFLRVWEDHKRSINGKDYYQVATDNPRTKTSGFSERVQHVEEIKKGADGYGVVCVAVDPGIIGSRTIRSFDNTTLVRFGEIVKYDGKEYAEINGKIPIDDLEHQRTSQGLLQLDLKSILRSPIGPTEKSTLIDARIGQGLFRKQVLSIWGNLCSVTGSSTLYAIRASHIKPWRNSSDTEKLDPFNGLPLIANIDALFDVGYVSFTLEGDLVISKRIDANEKTILGLKNQRLLKNIPIEMMGYIKYHLENIFVK